MPIRALLDRIRWDKTFGEAGICIGYYDRVDRALRIVPLTDLTFPADSPGAFELIDPEGKTHHIPLHRIKAVYRAGKLIWHREH